MRSDKRREVRATVKGPHLWISVFLAKHDGEDAGDLFDRLTLFSPFLNRKFIFPI